MTFHGMKPYDNAISQEREWEKEADFYGYVVCSPELKTCDSFMEYPLTTDKHGYVQADIKNVLAIMDHIFRTTLADPKRVLSTSWSCGGYFAHYFPNRFPDRFSCIATRLSNFSAELLREDRVRLNRKMPVALFIGDGDFAACKSESQQAVAWYTARDFEVVRGKMIDHMGHRRIPQTAAAFFAEQIGITPLHPIKAAQTVAQVQMTEYYPPKDLIAQMRPKGAAARVAKGPSLPKLPDSSHTTPPVRIRETQPRRTHDPTIRYMSMSAGQNYPFDRQPQHDLLPAPTPDKQDAQKSPPTAAGSTAVATARPTPGNRLDPVRVPDAAAGKSKPPADRTQRPKAPPAVKKPEATAQPARSEPPKATKPPQPFAPENAGPRDYSRWLASNRPSERRQPPKASNSRTQTKTQAEPQAKKPAPRQPSPRTAPPKKTTPTPKASAQPRTADAGADRSTTRRPPVQTWGGARRVDINIKGPAVGSAPYYLSYAVDLPRDVLRGADLLWKDNGVWMGDAPLGAKIIESPGVHRITLLLVSRDNKEYRGMATVHVLDDAAPTLTGGRPRPR
jgi:hypothetical protein